MVRWWMGVALVAGLTVGTPARAQWGTHLPSDVGAARMPEPLPCGPPGPQPNLIPGPISPQTAPMGPPDCLSLPADHTSAFQCEEFSRESHFYLSLGTQYLQRQALGAGILATRTSLFPGRDPDPVLQLNDIHPLMDPGILGTFGYMWDNCAVEVTSYYIFQNNREVGFRDPGRVDTLFYNPPAGFTGLLFGGDRFFKSANEIDTTFGSYLWNNELNFRRWNAGIGGFDLILGVRYLDEEEYLDIAVEAGRDQPGLRDRDGRQLRSTYSVLAHNQIVGFQYGGEYTTRLFNRLSVGGWGKGVAGANFIQADTALVNDRGDLGFDNRRSSTVFSQVYELGAFVDFNILERLRVRAAYQAMWMIGVATAPDQVEFNLGSFRQNDNGSIFWHGPRLEVQFLF